MATTRVNPDLQAERDAASFDTTQLTFLLDGGEGMTTRRREIEKMALDDLEYVGGPNYHYLSRSEKYSESVRKSVHYMKKVKELKFITPADAYWYRNHLFPNENPPISLHGGMFIPAIEGQCTQEQKEKWLTKATNYELIGTYAQTEMGHGRRYKVEEVTS